jgi:large conductance mechanosensitive channel
MPSDAIGYTVPYNNISPYMKNFLNFIREQGVVGLAIGFILGGAVSGLVKALIDDLINPLIGLILGSASGLETMSFPIFSATINFGHFVSVLINFVIIAAVVYYGFKALGLDKLDKKKDA